jgi:oligopeptidase A
LATEAFQQIIGDGSVTRDFPKSLLAVTAKDPSKAGQGPWTVTLKQSVAVPFMQYCPMRELRWNVWQAGVRRCSNEGERELNNSVHIEQLRSLRKDQAKLLGFESFADMSMETKMAGKLDTVRAMVATLLLKGNNLNLCSEMLIKYELK